MNKILRMRDVNEYTGLARSSVYRLMSLNLFPQSIKLTSRSVGWLETDIKDWIDNRVSSSHEANDVNSSRNS